MNVSKFGGRFPGVGGFVNITQTAKRLVFCGTFTAGRPEFAVESGKLRIVREGTHRKMVSKLEHLSFSAAQSGRVRQDVLYVTERAVFRLANEGRLELIEIAPGIDLQSDILGQMDFCPVMREVRTMPAHCFKAESKFGL